MKTVCRNPITVTSESVQYRETAFFGNFHITASSSTNTLASAGFTLEFRDSAAVTFLKNLFLSGRFLYYVFTGPCEWRLLDLQPGAATGLGNIYLNPSAA